MAPTGGSTPATSRSASTRPWTHRWPNASGDPRRRPRGSRKSTPHGSAVSFRLAVRAFLGSVCSMVVSATSRDRRRRISALRAQSWCTFGRSPPPSIRRRRWVPLLAHSAPRVVSPVRFSWGACRIVAGMPVTATRLQTHAHEIASRDGTVPGDASATRGVVHMLGEQSTSVSASTVRNWLASRYAQ